MQNLSNKIAKTQSSVLVKASSSTQTRPLSALPLVAGRREVLLGGATALLSLFAPKQADADPEAPGKLTMQARKERLAARAAERQRKEGGSIPNKPKVKEGEAREGVEVSKTASRSDVLSVGRKERLAALKEKAAKIRSGEAAPSF